RPFRSAPLGQSEAAAVPARAVVANVSLPVPLGSHQQAIARRDRPLPVLWLRRPVLSRAPHRAQSPSRSKPDNPARPYSVGLAAATRAPYAAPSRCLQRFGRTGHGGLRFLCCERNAGGTSRKTG